MATHNKLSKNIINERIKLKDIVMVGEFVNVKTKTIFTHLVCEYSWLASPHKIMQGTGCPSCYGNVKLSSTTVNDRLSLTNPEIIMIGEYENIKQKSLFKHLLCGTEWMAVPHSIINGKGCPSCVKYGFKSYKPGYGYIIEFQDFIKFGISNQYESRFRQHKLRGDFKVLLLKNFEDGKEAIEWEKMIKNKFSGNFVNKTVLPNGFTETLSISEKSELMVYLGENCE